MRDLASPRALVVRDGERCHIPGRDVVVGDMLALSEGDRWSAARADVALAAASVLLLTAISLSRRLLHRES